MNAVMQVKQDMGNAMDRWKQYLFESHSEATLVAWAKRLRLFRFFRAYGGHANDGDSLDVAYDYQDIRDLHRFFWHIQIPVVTFEEQPPQPEAGVSYPATEFAEFPSIIPGTHWIRQAGQCLIQGQRAFIWCDKSRIKISLGGDYQVTDAHVDAAEAIEKVLVHAPLTRIDPPVDNQHCICPKYYPAYFD